MNDWAFIYTQDTQLIPKLCMTLLQHLPDRLCEGTGNFDVTTEKCNKEGERRLEEATH